MFAEDVKKKKKNYLYHESQHEKEVTTVFSLPNVTRTSKTLLKQEEEKKNHNHRVGLDFVH